MGAIQGLVEWMPDVMTKPVPPITVGVLVSLASLIGFAVGLGVWGGTLSRAISDHEFRLNKLTEQQERAATAVATTNVTLAQIQAQLTYLVRGAQLDHPTPPPL